MVTQLFCLACNKHIVNCNAQQLVNQNIVRFNLRCHGVNDVMFAPIKELQEGASYFLFPEWSTVKTK